MSSNLPRCASLLALLAFLAFASAPGAGASEVASSPRGKVFLTVDEALALAFPKCVVERGAKTLSKTEQKRATALAGEKVASRLVFAYSATKDGRAVGTAYFDTHRVRTLRETVMVVVAPDGTIARLEVLAFAEPLDYLPRGNWYRQFLGRKLDDELSLKRGVKKVSGATLTSRATMGAARRVLAVHRVLALRSPKTTGG
ncbi:MAG: FMN-binding protein [Planctomycetota bacterium]|nr:MAG: FMN-binding protein [Planctomycetota bacterium]